jgi:uncharacterized protein with GYD domain
LPKYLVQFSYTKDGLQGLLKEGGSARRNALQHLAQSLGGTLESFYYAFGADDGLAILDVPDSVSVAAAALLVNASGAATTRTTLLLTAEEVDEAVKRGGDYRPPGR